MSFATARRDIENRMNDNWATTPIAWDNVHFNPPENGDPWVAFHIYEDATNRITIGNPGVHRISGTIVINIMVKENSGTAEARGYADTIGAIFRDAVFSGITCREVTLTPAGVNNGWYQLNLTIPFQWDGTYSV
jgi:hypothetical protein